MAPALPCTGDERKSSASHVLSFFFHGPCLQTSGKTGRAAAQGAEDDLERMRWSCVSFSLLQDDPVSPKEAAPL